MKNIIRKGEIPKPPKYKAECKCRHCSTLFSYEYEDVQNVEWFGLAVDCPLCKERNKAEELTPKTETPRG